VGLPPYWVALVVVSLVVLFAETIAPWRKQQRRLRAGLASDLAYLVFNGHFLGVGLYWLIDRYVAPHLGALDLHLAARWPTWTQILVFVVAFDFVQWCTHNLLHRVSWLWTFHKVHHSVADGQMDFLVSFRFHWLEGTVYKAVQYVPLVLLGFSTEAVFIAAVLGTLVGHLNHSNLNIGWGPLRYVLNGPRMHLWHHDLDLADGRTRNFGIVLSTWDWLFGTAYLPEHVPRAFGIVERPLPASVVGQELWPLWRRRL
jgi:sterol desaturase/sphingolipid hydroxylase (fatty acid hydroxylase superfamily)